MTPKKFLAGKENLIKGLLSAKNAFGKPAFKYAEICEMINIPNTSGNRHAISDLALRFDMRRRVEFTRNKPAAQPINPSLFIVQNSDKDRFFRACAAFAEIYFKEAE